jgi:mRNA interferase MazF
VVTFQRGSIVWVDFGSGAGAEQKKRRPAIVVSHNGANSAAQAIGYGVVTVVPVTSTPRSPQYFQTPLTASVTGLSRDVIAQAEHIRSVDVRRVSATSARLPRQALDELERAIRFHLGLYS